MALLAGSPQASVAADRSDEIKAAFVFNFVRYVKWPASAFGSQDAPLVVGVLGDVEREDLFRRVFAGEQVGGRAVEVVRLESRSVPQSIHAVFVGDDIFSSHEDLRNWLASACDSAVLTLSDADGFTSLGGIVGFIEVSNRLRFEINRSCEREGGLEISSQLLKLAASVGNGRS